MADYDDFDWKPYVPVAARRQEAARRLATLKKKGHQALPVVVEGRKIARTFWGEAWCENLERYSDFANRLPRGRSYVRNGSVVDLRIAPGSVTALVSGSEVYEIDVQVQEVTAARWRALCKDCEGAIDSVIELLQGNLSQTVMARMCQAQIGLFPSPKEIAFSCSCPDWAAMCKHIAAVLYGIGARLDEQPELLFLLRKVDHQDLVARAGSHLSGTKKVRAGKVLETGDLSEIFGIEIVGHAGPASAPAARAPKKPRASSTPAIRRR
jgi:uncharacterized Zn finger protein